MYHPTFLKTKCYVKLLSVGSLQRSWCGGGGRHISSTWHLVYKKLAYYSPWTWYM